MDAPTLERRPPARPGGRRALRARRDPRPVPAVQVWLGVGVYALLLLVATVTAINGTSTGTLHAGFFAGEDPRLVAGEPRPIRSDEWLVHTPLAVAQVENGLPAVSDLLPGGMDMTAIWDVPYREWSVAFKPQLWGFFVLPADHAFALRWWLPTAVLGAGAYALLVTLWRRPVAALAASAAFALSGFVQWWYLPLTIWPLAFATVTTTCTLWMLRSASARTRWLLALPPAYLGTVAVLALYPAFLVPALYATAAFCVGAVLTTDLPARERLRRVVPLVGAGVLVGAASAAYLLTRLPTIRAITSTLYPGHRLGPTGVGWDFVGPWPWAGVFGRGLTSTDLTGFAGNASEGSSFLLVGLLLVPSAVWLVARRLRDLRSVDWLLVALLACAALLLAYLYVPGWDRVAHLLLLDRTTGQRAVIGLGLVSFLLLAATVHRLVELGRRPPLWTALAGVGLAAGSHALVLRHLRRHAVPVLEAASGWPLLVAGLALAVWLFALGRRTVPAVLLLGVAFAVAGTVNPLYRGFLDLRQSDLGRAVLATDAAEPGAWVLVGDYRPAAVLRETGVTSYSGVQAAPNDAMWEQIDPDGSSERFWNRYAHISFEVRADGSEMTSSQVDTVTVTFDSCGPFVQGHVTYVVTQPPVDQPCLEPLQTVVEESGTYVIHRVVPAG